MVLIIKQKTKGFSLLETIVAIFIIVLGLLGAFSLLVQTITFSNRSSLKLTAAYLAQEGVEIVRNIRDTNWLEQRSNPQIPWNEGLPAGNWEADYNDLALTYYQARPLRIDGGFYNYDSGSETRFKRKITILPEGDNILRVSVLVEWQERGRAYQITVQENLYNWR